MSAVVWFLEYEGQKRPLRDWGIVGSSLSVTFNDQVPDEVVIEVAAPSLAAARFAYGKLITIWRDSVRWFTGPVIKLPYIGRGESDRQQYVLAGPWWYLENITYQQPRWLLADATTPTAGSAQASSSSAVLFQGADGSKIDTGGQVEDVIDYAIAHGAPIAKGTFSLATYVPYEKGQNLSCAEVIKRCTRWTRDAVAYWDFTDELPAISIRRRADLDVTELDVSTADHVVEFELTPREDLKLRGVIFDYERTLVDPTGNQYVSIERRAAGTADGGISCPVLSIPLAGIGHLAETVPEGLIDEYFSSVSVLQWEGSIVLQETECLGAVRPGNVVNLLGGADERWETMAAVVQRVTEDILRGVTTIEVGPPSQLGVQDFLDLAAFRRGQNAGLAPSSRFDGTPGTPLPPPNPNKPPPSPPPPGPPDPAHGQVVALKVCDPDTGKTITIWVQAVPSGI